MNRHLTDDELALHYYGEMSGDAEARASAHLDGCDGCRAALTRLQQVLALVDAGAPPTADAGFERRIWQQIEPVVRKTSPPRRLSWISPPLMTLAWSAAAAMVVVAAFVAGRASTSTVPATVATVTPAPATDRVLVLDLGDHLDRAELALVDFLMRNERSAVAGTEDLIAANRLYRGTAMAIGDENVVNVLDELERALIEIAAVPASADEGDREAVRQWIDSRDLLFKVRLIREGLEARAPGVLSSERQDASL